MSKHPSTAARVRPMSEVAARPVEWLWPGWIPLGKVTVLDGDPGLGKSTLLFDLAARLSRDGVMPDGAAGPVGASLILSAEDGEEDTIKPRLAAAGGDTTRLFTLSAVRGDDGEERPPEMPRDLPVIEAAAAERRPASRHRPAHGVSDRRGRQPRPGRTAGVVPAGRPRGASQLRGGLPTAPEQDQRRQGDLPRRRQHRHHRRRAGRPARGARPRRPAQAPVGRDQEQPGAAVAAAALRPGPATASAGWCGWARRISRRTSWCGERRRRSGPSARRCAVSWPKRWASYATFCPRGRSRGPCVTSSAKRPAIPGGRWSEQCERSV